MKTAKFSLTAPPIWNVVTREVASVGFEKSPQSAAKTEKQFLQSDLSPQWLLSNTGIWVKVLFCHSEGALATEESHLFYFSDWGFFDRQGSL